MPLNLSIEELSFVLNELSNGTPKSQIAKASGRGLTTIYRIEKESKLPPKIKKKRSVRKAKFNDDYFEEINTDEKAYWLGFWFADGCICYSKQDNSYICTLGLAAQDELHILKFAKSVNFDFSVGKITRKSNTKGFGGTKAQDLISIRLLSEKMFNDLTKLGCWQRKSLTLEVPNIEEKFRASFIRGYYDGDGGFSVIDGKEGYMFNTKVGITSTKKVLEYIQQGVLDGCGYSGSLSNGLSGKRSETYRLTYSGNRLCIKFFDYIYGNMNDPFLDRKFDKAIKCMERFCENGKEFFEKWEHRSTKIKNEEILKILIKFLGEEKLRTYGFI